MLAISLAGDARRRTVSSWQGAKLFEAEETDYDHEGDGNGN